MKNTLFLFAAALLTAITISNCHVVRYEFPTTYGWDWKEKKRFKHAPSDTLRDYTYYTKWPWIPIDYMVEGGGISVYRKDTLYHNPCVGAYVPRTPSDLDSAKGDIESVLVFKKNLIDCSTGFGWKMAAVE